MENSHIIFPSPWECIYFWRKDLNKWLQLEIIGCGTSEVKDKEVKTHNATEKIKNRPVNGL